MSLFFLTRCSSLLVFPSSLCSSVEAPGGHRMGGGMFSAHSSPLILSFILAQSGRSIIMLKMVMDNLFYLAKGTNGPYYNECQWQQCSQHITPTVSLMQGPTYSCCGIAIFDLWIICTCSGNCYIAKGWHWHHQDLDHPLMEWQQVHCKRMVNLKLLQ